MCLIRGAKWIYRQFFPDKEKKPLIPSDKFLVLRPDGSWILDDAKKPQPPKVIKTPLPQAPSAWYSYGPLDPIGPDVELKQPPSLFPFAQELENKLNDCIVAGVISSCIHTKTGNETYVLTIEIPIGQDKSIENTQLNLFCKVMLEKYNLSLVKRQKEISAISCHSYHVLVFEYDPRKQLFDK